MLRLVIGSKTYSSWSLRPWLLLRERGVAFEEQCIPYAGSWRDEVRRLSPSGRVPVLFDDELAVWDSLAICEYVVEAHGGWPAERQQRARARAVAAEMHAGFAALRQELPQNLRVRGRAPSDAFSAQCRAEIARIEASWSKCLSESRGPWLFGAFGVADAMYAPVALRFATYGIALGATATAYVARVEELPSTRAWVDAAQRESEEVEEAEALARRLGLTRR